MLTVDIEGLAAMLSYGQATARKIAEDAGARITIGRRVLYSVSQDREVSGSHSGINRRSTGTDRKCCRFLKIFSNHLSVGVDLCYTDGASQKSFRLARRYGTSKAQKGMILWQEKIIEEEI